MSEKSDKPKSPESANLLAAESTFKKKFENFWYYHKWHLIGGIFLAIVLGICISQSISKTDPDAYVLYAGECYLPEESVQEMERIFASAVEKDTNDDGKKTVELRDIVILSENKQVTALYQKRHEEEDGTYIYSGNTAANESDFYEEIAYGQTVVCLLDEAYFEKVRDEDRLATFEELYGESPENALDEYGIRIHDTEFGNYYELLRELPDDTVLCIKRPTVLHQKGSFWGSLFSSNKEDAGLLEKANDSYLAQVELLRAVLHFHVVE